MKTKPEDVRWTHSERQLCFDCSWWNEHRNGYLNGRRFRLCMTCGKMEEVIDEKTKQAGRRRVE